MLPAPHPFRHIPCEPCNTRPVHPRTGGIVKHTPGIPRTTIGILGASMTTVSGILILGLAAAAMQGFVGSPYIGIFAFLVLPGFFILGLLLIPLGTYLARRRARIAAERGEEIPLLPIVD